LRRIFAATSKALYSESPQNDEVVCDLTDKRAVNNIIRKVNPDGIIHLAALSYVAHQDKQAFYNVNVFGTLNILEALDEAGVTPDKIVIASSANVYGSQRVEKIDESVPPNPVNHYAMSKLAMEFMVKTWFDRFSILITRPFNYTGPGQDEKFLIPKIVVHFCKKKSRIELGNLDIARDFSDVRDIARAYLSLYECDAESDVMNLCSGRVYEIGDIIRMMDEISGYKIDVGVNSALIRKSEINVLRGENSKLKHLINYDPEFSLPKTLRDMYRKNLMTSNEIVN